MESSLTPPSVTYGFIGLGVMGTGMAKCLRSNIPSHSSLVVCEIVGTRLNSFLESVSGKIEVAHSPREIAQRCDIIITMLPAGPHVRDCFTNSEIGLLANTITSTTSKLFIESSTIDVKTSALVANAVSKSNPSFSFIDAPVSGGPNGAHAGTLTFMVGSSPALFQRALPILRTMGSPNSIFHCGEQGAGLATKAINNFLSFVCTLGTCEAMNMGRLYGLDPNVLASVINVSSGQNYNSQKQNPVKGVEKTAAAAKDFEGGFSMELCKGVVDMALELGEGVGAKSVLRAVVESVLKVAVESEKCRGRDCRSVYRLFVEEEGKELEKVAK